MTLTQQQQVRRTGLTLAAILLGVILYSFFVIKSRGSLPEPKNLTKLQRILRGL
jgi:hypothetical protein